jgi:hypothetical protein
MKTESGCLREEFKRYKKRTKRIKRMFTAIKDGKIIEGSSFWLFDGDSYTLCICLSFDFDRYEIIYSQKHKTNDPRGDTYIEMECWELSIALDEGCTVSPICEV